MRAWLAKRAWITKALRVLVALAGLAIVALVVRDAGPAHVLHTLDRAKHAVVLALLAELAWIAADAWTSRILLGSSATAMPRRVWIRSAFSAYAAAAFVPSGRFAGEVARALELAPHVGVARATFAGLALHGAHLVAAALVSMLACVALALSIDTPLVPILAVSGGWTCALGALFLTGSRVRALRGLLRKPLAALAAGHDVESDAQERPVVPVRAIGAQLVARLAQLVQAAVLLLAVDGAIDDALTAQGIQLVAGNVGDAMPGQAGVLEEGFRRFAGELELTTASAVSLALLLRAPRLMLAGGMALWLASSRGPSPSREHGRLDPASSQPGRDTPPVLPPSPGRRAL
jgi:hypothetical protein